MNDSFLSPALMLAIYCALVFLASLSGGGLPSLIHLTHTRLQTAINFITGLRLGMALLHLIPHAIGETHSVDGPWGGRWAASS